MERRATSPLAFVRTVKDRCRMCYTCVRECPAKAIRIVGGQAEVIAERCVACGNCVRVCSQGAKQAAHWRSEVTALLASDQPTAACLAPSFPAEFADVHFRVLVGRLRALGFDLVTEVAFGADLVAERYRRLKAQSRGSRHIGANCPAIVSFVERYHPGEVDKLTPVVSPMIAMARALHHLHGQALRVVFIGPCIAKMAEAAEPALAGDVAAVLTFADLRAMLEEAHIGTADCEPSDFDPPHPGLGALFPISRGMLQAAEMTEDLMQDEVVAADGLSGAVTAVDEFAEGNLEVELLEVLMCRGCIMGPGMTTQDSRLLRRARISQYTRYRMGSLDIDAWRRDRDRLSGLDLSRGYEPNDQRLCSPSNADIESILQRMGKFAPGDELNCGACGYRTCREHAIAIYKGFAEAEMCLPHTIHQLQKAVEDLRDSHQQLQDTQEQLLHSEKLANMGQLAAGVAHELNNPLGVVIMYAHLVLDAIQADSDLHGDLHMIAEQADRCKKIVSNLLDFARESKVLIQDVEIDGLIRTALQSVPVPDGVVVERRAQHERPTFEGDADQLTQVLTNLFSNAYAAMPGGGTLLITTHEDDSNLFIEITDSGMGIPEQNVGRIFQPFFTTKKFGKGTGLGLAVTYGIIKMHRGDIQVASQADPQVGPTGTTFTIRLPRNHRASVPRPCEPARTLEVSS